MGVFFYVPPVSGHVPVWNTFNKRLSTHAYESSFPTRFETRQRKETSRTHAQYDVSYCSNQTTEVFRGVTLYYFNMVYMDIAVITPWWLLNSTTSVSLCYFQPLVIEYYYILFAVLLPPSGC